LSFFELELWNRLVKLVRRVGAVSKALGLSASRVRELADEGRIPSKRTSGGHRLFDLTAVRQAHGWTQLRAGVA